MSPLSVRSYFRQKLCSGTASPDCPVLPALLTPPPGLPPEAGVEAGVLVTVPTSVGAVPAYATAME
jgi:hypothetical protein